MKIARAIRVILSMVYLVSFNWGQDDGFDGEDFDLANEFKEFEEGNSFFNPKSVIEGMILGDILQRIEHLEEFCKVDDKHLKKPSQIPAQPSFAPRRHLGTDENTNEEPGLFFPPSPFNPADAALTSKLDEVGATLQLLKQSVDHSKREQTRLRGDLEVVMQEVTSVQQQMAHTKQDIVHTKEELMAAMMETNGVLMTQSKDINKLKKNISTIAAVIADIQHDISHLNELEQFVKQAVNSYGKTSRHVDTMARNVTSLQAQLAELQTSWNQSMRSSREEQKSNATDRFIARISRQLSGIKKRLKKVDSAKCETGREMFMNYPFYYGKWPQKREIQFAKPFLRRPVVTLGITQLDVSYKYNTRAGVRVVKRSNVGFTVSCDGWYNTRLYRVEVTWMACLV